MLRVVSPALLAPFALVLWLGCVANRRAGDGPHLRRRRGLAAGTVALVRCLAGHGRGNVREASVSAGVVDLHPAPVLVVDNEGLASEEVCIDAIGTHPKEAGGESPASSRDQLDPLARVPLVGVFLAIQIAIHEALCGVEEDPPVVGQAAAVGGERGVPGSRLSGRVAGSAVDPIGPQVVANHLTAAEVFVPV